MDNKIEEFKMNLTRKIEATKEVRESIAKTFGVTQKTVFNALTYDVSRGFTDVAKRIRKMALQNGAIHVIIAPESQIMYDDGETIHQTLHNGVLLEIKKKTGTIRATYKGKYLFSPENEPIRHLNYLQEQASAFTREYLEKL